MNNYPPGFNGVLPGEEIWHCDGCELTFDPLRGGGDGVEVKGLLYCKTCLTDYKEDIESDTETILDKVGWDAVGLEPEWEFAEETEEDYIVVTIKVRRK